MLILKQLINNRMNVITKYEYQSQLSRILFLFVISAASRQAQLNSYQSQLLSLSNTASFFRIFLVSSPYSSLLYFLSVHPSISRVSLNLRESLLVLSNTTINFLLPDWQQLARHGPAVTVTPVFTPINPSRLSSLLVFYQISSFFPPSLCTHSLQTCVLMILQKSGISMQAAMRRARSQGVEVFLKSGRPWGLPKLDCFSSSYFEFLFIIFTNAFNGSSSGRVGRREPPHSASATAASLPLGSMSPQRSCSTVRVSPTTSSAEVPLMSEASSQTVASCVARSSCRCAARRWTVQKVMILVRLAISAGFLQRLPVRILRVGCSRMMKLSAFIFSSYFLSKWMSCFCLSGSGGARLVSEWLEVLLGRGWGLGLGEGYGLRLDCRVLQMQGVLCWMGERGHTFFLCQD